MIHHACVQGSEEWRRLRLGRPRASEMERVITPSKKETKDGVIKGWQPVKGEARRNYLVYLLTELILDIPLNNVTTASMDHGHDFEPKARACYEMLKGIDVELCGLCETDDGKVVASPDGLVPALRRSAEIKCPEKPENHVGYMLDEQRLVDEYWVQTQSQLYVLGADYDSTDLISYFGGMPMVCVNVPKHPEFQERLDEVLKLFTNDLALYVDLAKTKGWIKDREEPKVRDVSKDFISDADLEAILAARKG